MNQLKMDTTKIVNQVSSPYAGDDGEAVEKRQRKDISLPQKYLEKPDNAGWFVAVVRCNCEKKIADEIKDDLNYKNIWFESWVPMQKIHYVDKRTNKRRTKKKIFLSTFIFCHVGKEHLNEIRFRSDVYKMLTMPGQCEIYQISDSVLENYRQFVENPDIPVVSYSGPLKKGQKVRITEGKLAGVEAYVQRISGKKAIVGNEIKYINGATIEIDRGFLKVIE